MDITDENFKKEVLESKKLVVVDFWAPWCMPCQILKPTLEELANEVKDKADVKFVNVDDCPETAKEYNIMSVPAVLFFKNGELVDTAIGTHAKENYIKIIDELS